MQPQRCVIHEQKVHYNVLIEQQRAHAVFKVLFLRIHFSFLSSSETNTTILTHSTTCPPFSTITLFVLQCSESRETCLLSRIQKQKHTNTQRPAAASIIKRYFNAQKEKLVSVECLVTAEMSDACLHENRAPKSCGITPAT